MLGGFLIRGERPIKLNDSWFSTKSILVEHVKYKNIVKTLLK